jgi:hypothetical protein
VVNKDLIQVTKRKEEETKNQRGRRDLQSRRPSNHRYLFYQTDDGGCEEDDDVVKIGGNRQ